MDLYLGTYIVLSAQQTTRVTVQSYSVLQLLRVLPCRRRLVSFLPCLRLVMNARLGMLASRGVCAGAAVADK